MKCWKCGGAGNLPQYSHIQGGICFACRGTGEVKIPEYKIVNTFSTKEGTKLNPNQSIVKRNNAVIKKDVGDATLPFDFNDVLKQARAVTSEEVAEKVAKSFKNIVEKTERKFPGLISNVVLTDMFTKADLGEDIAGQYYVDNSKHEMHISLKILIKSYEKEKRLIESGGKELWEKQIKRIHDYYGEFLVHELSHAYHLQVLHEMNSSNFENSYSKKGSLNEAIHKRYFEELLYASVESGIAINEINELYLREEEVSTEAINKVKGRFYDTYGALNENEYFAVLSQKLFTRKGRNRLEKEFPSGYELLKKVYEGVIEL